MPTLLDSPNKTEKTDSNLGESKKVWSTCICFFCSKPRPEPAKPGIPSSGAIACEAVWCSLHRVGRLRVWKWVNLFQAGSLLSGFPEMSRQGVVFFLNLGTRRLFSVDQFLKKGFWDFWRTWHQKGQMFWGSCPAIRRSTQWELAQRLAISSLTKVSYR